MVFLIAQFRKSIAVIKSQDIASLPNGRAKYQKQFMKKHEQLNPFYITMKESDRFGKFEKFLDCV